MKETQNNSPIPALLKKHESTLLRSWLAAQARDRESGSDSVSKGDLERQSKEFLTAFQVSSQTGDLSETQTDAWERTQGRPFRYLPGAIPLGSDAGRGCHFYFFL